MSAFLRLFGHPAVVRCAQVALGILLAWAALAKLGDIPALARDIHGFRLLHPAGDNLVAIVLPWIELTAAASLVLGIRPRAGAFAALGLLLLFTTAVALAVIRGLDIECGCFGTVGAIRTGGAKLAENLGMLALAAIGAMKPVPRETTTASRAELRT